MSHRPAAWLVVGVLPLLASCAASSDSVELGPVGPQVLTADEFTSKGYPKVDTARDDTIARSEADIVRLPDGRIVGLLPPEGTP